MPIRTVSTGREVSAGIESVWQMMTNRQDLSWRGDLLGLQVATLSEGEVLIETLRGGLTARFLVTRNQPYQYEQQLTGEMVSRSWGFSLTELGPERTRITLEERYEFKNRLLLLLSYPYLRPKALQKEQLKELARRLKNRPTQG